MKDAITYLYNRITEAAEIKAQSPRANISAGCRVILDLYGTQFPTKDDLEILFGIAYDGIQIRAKSKSVARHIGECLLTNTSAGIGRSFREKAGDYHTNTYEEWKKDIAIGDLVVESLYNTDYINLRYSNGQRAYIIELCKRWAFISTPKKHIKGTVSDPITPITGLYQANGRAIIKGWIQDDKELFTEYLHTPHIQALDTIQRQGWVINTPVYAALLRDRMKRTEVDESSELKRLQSISKASEYRSIVSVVSRLRKWDQFHQYVECDYRGRVYFRQPFFNFQGSDTARGLFLFDKPRRVTAKGLKWLARHTATCFNETYHKSHPFAANYRDHLDAEGLDDISVDKMTLEDRERWTYENMDLILSTWGLDDRAEKSVSFLACCYEWRKYEENKEHFFSRLPIPIDGSNNGWQHLAAISADAEAGRLVGLVPTDIPEDFYVQTAKALKELVPDWFEKRDIPMKHIRKGISKRGSMTRAYSAGAGKIAENMYMDCRTEGFDERYDITLKDCNILAKNLVQAIDVVCPGPLQTMKYLQQLAVEDIKQNGEPTMYWETPSGFPVVYHAPRMDKKRYRLRMRGKSGTDNRINHIGLFPTEYPDIKKFMSGISPNFIHSLDATHMCLVLSQWDGAFGGVHDSFSTHADDVDELLALTKAVFVDMYDSGSNFKDIKRILKLEDSETTEPNLGSLTITEVKDSDYFFA